LLLLLLLVVSAGAVWKALIVAAVADVAVAVDAVGCPAAKQSGDNDVAAERTRMGQALGVELQLSPEVGPWPLEAAVGAELQSRRAHRHQSLPSLPALRLAIAVVADLAGAEGRILVLVVVVAAAPASSLAVLPAVALLPIVVLVVGVVVALAAPVAEPRP
jgi:hypothetical protein